MTEDNLSKLRDFEMQLLEILTLVQYLYSETVDECALQSNFIYLKCVWQTDVLQVLHYIQG